MARRAALLSEEARARVDQAIAAAEKTTSAEIVTIAARRSGRYQHVPYQLGLAGALIALAGAAAYGRLLHGEWPTTSLDAFALLAAAGFSLGAFLSQIPIVGRAFTDDETLLKSCELRAHQLFTLHGMSKTRARTGVLLFVSFYERMVLVWGDSAVTAKLGPNDYQHVVEAVIEGVKSGKPEEGFLRGLALLGDLLGKHLPREADDVNEIPDRLYLIE